MIGTSWGALTILLPILASVTNVDRGVGEIWRDPLGYLVATHEFNTLDVEVP